LWRDLSERDQESVIMSFLRDVAGAAGAPGAVPDAADPDFRQRYPALFEWVTRTRTDAGAARKPASLTLFCEDGFWKVCLREQQGGHTLWASGETFGDALDALDGLLQAERVPWRAPRAEGGTTRRKGPISS
jgi:hypothetical protein